MNGRKGLFVLGAGLMATLALVGAASTGCQSSGSGSGGNASSNGGNTSQGTTTNSGGSGTGGSGTMSTSTSTASNTGGSTTTSTTSSTGTSSNCTFDMEASIEDLTKGTIGPGVKVKLTGVIAMSTQYKVSGPGSSGSGSCLWGVYLSEPGLTTTKEYSGIIGLSYGDNATTNDAGKMFCPVPPLDPANSAFPEDIQPGDEVTVIGKTSLFPTMNCGTPQVQLANICSVTKTASGKPTPTPAVLSSAVATALAGSDPDIHNKWGGVKVEIDGVDTVDPQD